jgi:hypothetical protein
MIELSFLRAVLTDPSTHNILKANTYASQANLQLVGYYQASPSLHDSGIGPVGEKILTKLRETVPEAVGLLVRR